MSNYKIEEITNKVIYCDNLKVMRKIPDNSVDLIYLDPPFFSNGFYQVIWGDKDEVRSFEDRFKGDIEFYFSWMKDRLQEMHRILKLTGSIYLHCDWHASHYLKIEMDKIFGYNNFQNDIVWSRDSAGKSHTRFGRKHDTILFYSKTEKYNFNEIRMPFKNEEQYNQIDEVGRKYKFGNTPGRRYYLDEGGLCNDFWTDIGLLGGRNKTERLGYPTQKPEALLERIIKASSNEGDIVLDPFMGGGTSIAVAKKLNRNFIGIDVSLIACKVTTERMKLNEKDIIGIPVVIENLQSMSPHEFQQWVCTKMSAKNTNPNGAEASSGADEGKDGIIIVHNTIQNLDIEKYNGCPLEVKQHKSNVGSDVIHKIFSVMLQMDKKYAFVVAFGFSSGAYEMIAKLHNTKKAEIKLITAEELLKLESGTTYFDNL